MFDLDHEIEAWARGVLPADCDNEAERRAELEDHLRCEIEALQERGRSPERAFHAAIERLGDQTRLAKEFAKNRSLLRTLCLIEGGRTMNEVHNPLKRSLKLGLVIVVQSIVWAAVMMAVSSELADTAMKPIVLQWLTAGWFTSFALLLTLVDSAAARAECAWILRRLGVRKRG